MIIGEKIVLRTIRESDLDQLYQFHQDINNRGPYFPTGFLSELNFHKQYQESGFWGKDEGMLLIVNAQEEIVGHIEFFQTVSYLDELELSYQIYDPTHYGKGFTTEAVNLMNGYLFDRKKHNRIRLIIHPENTGSRRVAEKCGFKYEGISRGAWYHQGRNHDVAVYALLRNEYYNEKESRNRSDNVAP
jgi:RimJ/RimL family protein N-acetyltransferase